jgi:hypothetical protein
MPDRIADVDTSVVATWAVVSAATKWPGRANTWTAI